ncbi:hypothetical protein JNB71_02310 [Rhizobium herbae]|uniref:Uncharacterized protein n=1 Tax=Rhizobium herbae TaxID=508661 RepID=A0ABS7H4T8_9HYPH|nr:hypothetical protein [Rhizobium herbae]
MKTDDAWKQRADRVWLTQSACDLEDFRREVERTTQIGDYPHAAGVEKKKLTAAQPAWQTSGQFPGGRF